MIERGKLDIAEGVLPNGLPYRALGSGRPLLFLRWFIPDHANPAGLLRISEIKRLVPSARQRPSRCVVDTRQRSTCDQNSIRRLLLMGRA